VIIPASTQELLARFNLRPKQVLRANRMYALLSAVEEVGDTIKPEGRKIAQRAEQIGMLATTSTSGIYRANQKALEFVQLYEELAAIERKS